MRQAEAQLASAQTSVRSARTPYLPTVDLTYSRAGNGFDKYYGIGSQSLAYTNNFAIRLAYPLFNNYQREDALNRARVQADVADATLRDARLALSRPSCSSSARCAPRSSASPSSRYPSKPRVKTSACSSRYTLGASTLLDLLTSQSTLDAARSALIQARQDFRVARAQLEALVGRELQ